MTGNRFHQTDERQRATAASSVMNKSKNPGYLTEQFRVFKPQDGINTIRLLPRLADDPHGDVYGFQFYQYYINKKYLCAPDTLDRNIRNPLFEEYNKQFNRQNKENPEASRDFRGVQRRMVFLLVFSDDTKGAEVQIWPAPISVIQKIMDCSRSLQDNGALIPVEDIEEGRKILIEKTGQGIKTDYKVELESAPTQISEKVADHLVFFQELFNVPSVEYCEALIVSAKQEAASDEPLVPQQRRAVPAVGQLVNDDEAPAPRDPGEVQGGFVVPTGSSGSVASAVASVKERLP